MQQAINTRTLIATIGIILVSGLLVSLYFFFTLRIVSSDPSSSQLPTSQNQLSFTFNQAIETHPTISIKEGYRYSYFVSGKTLVIRLIDPLTDGASLTVSFTATSRFETATFVRTYAVKYVKYSDLTIDQQKQQITESNSFETDYPLITKLPYISENFQIDYRFPSDDSTKLPIIITSLAVNTEDPSAAADAPSSLALLRQSRNEAMAFLKENGYDKQKYQLYFTEPYLLSDFDGKNAAELK